MNENVTLKWNDLKDKLPKFKNVFISNPVYKENCDDGDKLKDTDDVLFSIDGKLFIARIEEYVLCEYGKNVPYKFSLCISSYIFDNYASSDMINGMIEITDNLLENYDVKWTYINTKIGEQYAKNYSTL